VRTAGRMRRELNEIEYLNWCIDQPYNMVVAVRIRGGARADRLREALDKAQRRHPLLGVNTEEPPGAVPWLTSEGVGAIPLDVVRDADPEAAQRLVDAELRASFARGSAASPRLPLLRASLLLPRDPSGPADLVLTAQHVIADGLSMVFLVRDLLHFMEDPEAPVTVIDAPESDADLFPPEVRRRIPRSPLRFHLALAFARLYVRFFVRRRDPSPRLTARHRTWELDAAQTVRLRARCKREGVSVQSAICAALAPSFPAIHTPVSLRPYLARPVGESLGLYVGAAEVSMKYRDSRGFWPNARRFHRRLHRALASPFGVFRLFSKVVPADDVRALGPLLVAIAGRGRPFAVTNLGDLDRSGIALEGRALQVESFFGAVSAIVDSSVITVATIAGKLRLHLLANESGPSDTTVQDDVDRAVQRLLGALDESGARLRARRGATAST